MDIKGNIWDVAKASKTSQKRDIPQNLAAEGRFKDVLLMLQNDGLIPQDASAQTASLSDEQKQQLQNTFNIGDMAAYSDKRALLNELVKMGALSAEESELSMFQVLPQTMGTGAVVQTGMGAMMGMWNQTEDIEAIMNEPNYLSYLEKAIEMDSQGGRSDDVKAARLKLYDVLQNVFGQQ